MSWLLDTCVISEATKKAPQPRVVAWLDEQNEAEFYLSVLTLGEIEKGIARLRHSQQKRRLVHWLRSEVVARFAGRILSVDEEVARVWGRMLADAETRGRSLPTVDSLIAATAVVRHLVVVTRNTSDMRATGVEILDPWG